MRHDYGVGAALAASLDLLRFSSRGTGRSNHMIDCLKDGDRVVFLRGPEARRVERICKERKIDVQIVVREATIDGVLSLAETRPGVTHFDHSWVEEFYNNSIRQARNDLAMLQQAVTKEDEARDRPYPHKFEVWND